MQARRENLTVTLHWLVEGLEQTTTVVCEDSPPVQLIPLLAHGCGLPTHDRTGHMHRYQLRNSAIDGPVLPSKMPLSIHGIRSGTHLWLTEQALTRQIACLLSLPDRSTITLPQHRLALTRAWCFHVMALLNPGSYQAELARLAQRTSAYAYVSREAHCDIGPEACGGWSIATQRTDLTTFLNQERLPPATRVPLRDGDRIMPGDAGPTLRIQMVTGHIESEEEA